MNDWNHLDQEMHQQVLNHLWSVAVKCCFYYFYLQAVLPEPAAGYMQLSLTSSLLNCCR
jgi:hypothetical protein